MCGISGFIKYNSGVSGFDKIVVERMNKKLLHRGPDAQSTLLFDNVAFGFTRLSIIGLDNGMQPICNEDDSIVLICNGEIFNYIELREQLKIRGHSFRTNSDVEVIVHLYEEMGIQFLSKLNGQFAFALYDKKKQVLFCVRDQMGIIPFFYSYTNESFIFASEIKAILEHPSVKREVDLVGLDQVFTFPGLISPRTMFKNIHSLENGHYVRIDSEGKLDKVEYWDLVYPEVGNDLTPETEEFYVNRLEELFDASVKLRLRTEVPYGFYLSGGLDSSMIAMKIHQRIPTETKEAFSIDFIDSQLSESFYQKLMARESNSKLNQKIFFYKDISERLRNSIYHSECPIKETYNTASLSLSEAVRSAGIKVILSGEGSDELFAGYIGYRFDKMRGMSHFQTDVSQAEKDLRARIWGDPDFFYEANYLDFNTVKRNLYSETINASFEEVNCLNSFVINRNRLTNRSTLNKRAYLDYKLRLVDHLVSDHGDRMGMANSVEVRYPFLDKNLVEFSTTIPCELKLKDFEEKYILKQMAKGFLPMEIIEREKFGFVAPGSPYLLQNNVEYINDILSYDQIKGQNYFNPDAIEKLKTLYQQEGFTINAPFESDLLITVITFGILLEKFF